MRHGRPRITVVVTATGSAPHLLRETLQSVRNQRTPALEILVICLDEGARRTTAEVAGDDNRVVVASAATLSEARLLGVRRAQARHVILASPGDVLLPGAVVAALEVLGEDGETPVVLATPGDPPGPGELVHSPGVADPIRLGRLVVTGLALEDVATDPDPDGASVAARLLRRGFVVTPRPAYRDDRLVPAPPFSVRADPLRGLGARVARDERVLADLRGLDAAQAVFATSALRDLRPLLEVAEVATSSDWETLRAHARDLFAVAGDRVEAIDVVARVMARLTADDRRDDLVRLVVARRFVGLDFPTVVADGDVVADLGVAVAAADLRVSPHEAPLRVRLRRLLVEGDRLVLEALAAVPHTDQREAPALRAQLRDGDRMSALDVTAVADPATGSWISQWLGDTEHDHDAGLVRLSCPVDRLERGSWSIELSWDDGGLRRAGRADELDPTGSAGRLPLHVGGLGVRLRAGADGVRLRVADQPDRAAGADVESLEVHASDLHLSVRGHADRVWIAGGTGSAEGVRQHHGGWIVPLAHDVWGLGERPLPTGGYRLHLEAAEVQRPARLDPALVDRLPEETRAAAHRVRLQRADGDGLVVRLDPLLADDERGPRAQRLLQRAAVEVTEPLDERLVYFQSFTGQWAVDHPLAIQRELARLRPDVRMLWAVSDSSSTVPDEAEPVLFRSRAWYDALARAGHLVTNIELERWFRRRPGQRILQTFHGYPSKTMGLGLWRSRGLLPSHLEQQLDHTSRTWNALLTPDPAMDRYYREEYAYDGRILALGYPRDDVLVGPDRHAIRTDTRHRLGIAPGQRAVLYAPTWRDDRATNFRAAEAVHHLDVQQAAAALGDDYVLLLRGHRFHTGAAAAGAHVIDVTTYPDVNDLILAADVAVLDYSSLRFDFALTGRPMVFLVPDLDDYGSRTRGFLWDFGETAPGPWVRDTAAVVAQLRDLDGLAARGTAPLVAFNARYNSLQDGHAAERVVADFFADLPAPLSGP